MPLSNDLMSRLSTGNGLCIQHAAVQSVKGWLSRLRWLVELTMQEAFQEEVSEMPPLPQDLQIPSVDTARDLPPPPLPQDAGASGEADISRAEGRGIDTLELPGIMPCRFWTYTSIWPFLHKRPVEIKNHL